MRNRGHMGLALARAWLVTLSALSFAAGAAEAQQRHINAGIHDIPPFGGSTPSGYCFDLLRAMADRLGAEVEFHPMPVGAMTQALKDQKIDLYCSPQGHAGGPPVGGAAFVGPIAVNREVLLVRNDDQAEFRSLADAAGSRLGTIQGTLYVKLASSAGVADIKTYPNLVEGLTALANGEIDAFLGAEPLFRYQQRILGKWEDLRMVDSYVSVAENHPALGILEENTALISLLQPTLDGMIDDGTMQRLLDAWALPGPLP